MKLMAEAQEKKSQGKLVELVVDGPSLNNILGKFMFNYAHTKFLVFYCLCHLTEACFL